MVCGVIRVVTEVMVNIDGSAACPSVLCDVISVVAEFMVESFSVVWRHQRGGRVHGCALR